MQYLYRHYSMFVSNLQVIDFIPSLALRLFLAPVFILAGSKKLAAMDSTIAWFANPDWGLGLPAPELLAWLATLTEYFGGYMLLFGVAVRLVSIPLLVTMIVAAITVHLEHGWQMVADPNWFGANERVLESANKLARAKSILQENGNYQWLTSSGNFVVLNNGIETAVTYAVMLLALLKLGPGRYVSVDYWAHRYFTKA